MFKRARPVSLLCETSLHAGTGVDLGVVDMPIQREKHTGFPKMEGSGVKGGFRQAFEQLTKISFAGKTLDKDALSGAISLSFGPEKGDLHAGALGFTDARLLLFPVKSMKGVFAWITCPFVLGRFYQDLRHCNRDKNLPPMPPENSTPANSTLYVKDRKIVLEEYTFDIVNAADENCTELAKWLSDNMLPGDREYHYWKTKMKTDVVVLPDTDFSDFVNLSTEVVTRTKIDTKTGTVQSGALFTEEYLPQETLLYTLALATPIFNEDKGVFAERAAYAEEQLVMEYFVENLPPVVQMGANATTGKGLIRTKAVEV